MEQWRVGIDQQLREIRLTLLQLQKRYEEGEGDEWRPGWND
jgi:hypothetical protein